MSETVLIQLIISVAGMLTGMFAVIKYSISESNKREQALLDNFKEMQREQLEYYTTKNGHMERMAKEFTTASNKMSSAVNKLSAQITVSKVIKPKKK